MQLDTRPSLREVHDRERTLGEIVTLVGLLTLLGIAALAGGIMMLADPTGASLGMDTTLLADVPLVDDFFVPGVLLTVLLGVFPWVEVVGLLGGFGLPGLSTLERATGYRWPLVATLAQGLGVIAWIGVQLMWLPETVAVQWVTLTIGVLIVVFALLPNVRDRYRLVPR